MPAKNMNCAGRAAEWLCPFRLSVGRSPAMEPGGSRGSFSESWRKAAAATGKGPGRATESGRLVRPDFRRDLNCNSSLYAFNDFYRFACVLSTRILLSLFLLGLPNVGSSAFSCSRDG